MLDGVTSDHSRRSYRTGLVAFFGWIKSSEAAPAFTRALVQQYRVAQISAGMSAATLNLRCVEWNVSLEEMDFVARSGTTG